MFYKWVKLLLYRIDKKFYWEEIKTVLSEMIQRKLKGDLKIFSLLDALLEDDATDDVPLAASTVAPVFLPAPTEPESSTEDVQKPALALEQDILHDNQSQVLVEEVVILHEHENATTEAPNATTTGLLSFQITKDTVLMQFS